MRVVIAPRRAWDVTAMRLPDPVRRIVLRLLPWYHADEVEARHSQTRDAVTGAQEAIRRSDIVIASYRRAGRRLAGR